MSGSCTSMAKTCLPYSLSLVSSRLTPLPMIFHSLGCLHRNIGRHRQLCRVGGDLAVAQRAAGRRVRDHAVRPRSIPSPARPSAPRRPRSAWRAPLPRPAHIVDGDRECRGCRRWTCRPRRAWRRGSPPAIRIRPRTLFQSQSSSSATSWARPVIVPCPISERAMRTVVVSSGPITAQMPTSAPSTRGLPTALGRRCASRARSRRRPRRPRR